MREFGTNRMVLGSETLGHIQKNSVIFLSPPEPRLPIRFQAIWNNWIARVQDGNGTTVPGLTFDQLFH